MFAPPFRDPFNYNLDPLIPLGSTCVGAAMHTRFVAEGKPGVDDAQRLELFDVVERRPAHHGVLPQHDRAAHRDDRQSDADARFRSSPSGSCRAAIFRCPIAPQEWHFRQSIDYSSSPRIAPCSTSRRAIARHFLFNIYRMGKNSIERGSTRHVDG